ncbi:2,3-diketo-5-methylthio-1-phosphopentane phosphatase [Spizellomyces punctatus DAOM BR117]|uniref:2,3-diketo-5-methylthio-1-phosphopentane phosphatase n=1 Tax=Spizellomyces punctatus (strain DAOM BR117) TaxID=645134 RepID=A0A0L0H791_SPIPD|nr:2,3-diketo-5-methylthio-1-phosphopentane phosphatase [Spizellomyces punctatus DAOM BR117]KNC96844.1 2,3-diketo-5-methylthio-1-phosphopentane phosphatase [Spizellomyces punctatus DAOM BR117]|eukprot:XP_016604884.1 2,3-diketo-5-methylthio-1-phosphopentane phosphatase [Spizellomyces punctatus DAOM BR117]
MTAQKTLKPFLIAFDFDWTLIDEDSDRYIFSTLSPPLLKKLYELHGTVQWTDLMAQLHEEMFLSGVSAQEVLEAWRGIPFNPATAKAITKATAHAKLIILSDSNTVAIKEILETHALTPHFDTIITNPAHFDSTGCLLVHRLIPPTTPHSCPNGCAVNICKGQALMEYIHTHGPFDHIIYVGDGRNDLCPATKLSSTDYVLPRTGHALASLLSPTSPVTSPGLPDPVRSVPDSVVRKVCARVVFWKDGGELERVLDEVLGGVQDGV